MFCPQCGSTQSDELRFCKNCGTNLSSVKIAVVNPERVERSGLEGTWVGEMLMTRHEKDRVRGLTPEQKRRREIKAGIITASSGVSLSVVLSVLMEAIVINGKISLLAADILSRLWIVGLIPIMVGLALIANGVFISPRGKNEKIVETISDQELPPADTNQLTGGTFSVTENTTRHLNEPVPVERIKTK